MTSFTPDTWAGWQSSDDAVMRRAMAKWHRNLAAYRRHIRALAPRLGPAGRFFTDHSLHDGHLLAFHVTDCPFASARGRPSDHVSTATISVLGWVNDNTPYGKVRRASRWQSR